MTFWINIKCPLTTLVCQCHDDELKYTMSKLLILEIIFILNYKKKIDSVKNSLASYYRALEYRTLKLSTSHKTLSWFLKCGNYEEAKIFVKPRIATVSLE